MNTIIELMSVYDYANIDEDEMLFKSFIGYYSTYEKVEAVIKDLCKADSSYKMFITDEYVIDNLLPVNDDGFDDWECTRQYKFIDGSVVMVHEVTKEYKGHIASEYDYKSGDIIKWMNGPCNACTGIVCMPPMSIEEAKVRGIEVDSFDDCYHVYCLGEGDTHEHVPTVSIVGYADVSPDEYKAYKDKLSERLKNNARLCQMIL